MFCEKCGSEVIEGQKFCHKCGAAIKSKAPEPVNSKPQVNSKAQVKSEPQVESKVQQVTEKNGKKHTNKRVVGILAVVAIVVALLIPDTVRIVSKINDERKAARSEAENSQAAAVSESDNGTAKSQGKNDDKDADETVEEAEDGPKRIEYFNCRVDDGMYSFSDDTRDFVFFTDENKFYAPFASIKYKMDDSDAVTFSDKKVTRIENYEYKSCVITADGKNYIFNTYTETPLMLNEKSVNPACVHNDVTYVIPTSSDGTVGDLYYMNSIYEEEQLIAKNVIANTAGINYYSASYDEIEFLYTKEENGKQSLVLAYTNEETIEKGDFKIYEIEIATGNIIPLFVDRLDCAYYDKDKKEIIHVVVDDKFKKIAETKKIYSGNIDEYYVFDEGNELFIIDGDNVYGYYKSADETKLVLSTGLESIEYHGKVSPCGYNNGHRVFADVSSCLLTDKNQEVYFGGIKSGELVKPNRKLGEDKAYYYPSGAISYIKDGILYIDSYGDEEGIENFILFDKEKVKDFCSDYTGKYTFVYTEKGRVYLLNGEEKKVKLVDSGVDYNKEGDCANFAYGSPYEDLYYSKNGEFYCYDIDMESIGKRINHENWKISRDWNYNYITSEAGNTHLLHGDSEYDCY